MTRKDYILIAEAINASILADPAASPPPAWDAASERYERIVTEFVTRLAEQNPHFDERRFRQTALAALTPTPAA